jgi:hypothetical protein
VILGFALAYYLEGSFSPLLFTLTMLGIIAAMIGSYTEPPFRPSSLVRTQP